MKIVDLAHLITEDMPVYPGTHPPEISQSNTMEAHGFREKSITMVSHTGTHIDAPAHLLKTGRTLDSFPLAHFAGNGIIIDCSNCCKGIISLEDLVDYEKKLASADFVLLKTGWDSLWNSPEYFKDYPVLTQDAARWLCRSFKLKGIGIDAISFDREDSTDFVIHHVFLEEDIILIENLTNLSMLGQDDFIFTCFPLKIIDADGSPVRAAGILR